MCNVHVDNDTIWYTCLIPLSLICFMLYEGYYASLMCPACDVTAWVRKEQQYPGHGKGPHAEIYVAPKWFGTKT